MCVCVCVCVCLCMWKCRCEDLMNVGIIVLVAHGVPLLDIYIHLPGSDTEARRLFCNIQEVPLNFKLVLESLYSNTEKMANVTSASAALTASSKRLGWRMPSVYNDAQSRTRDPNKRWNATLPEQMRLLLAPGTQWTKQKSQVNTSCP